MQSKNQSSELDNFFSEIYRLHYGELCDYAMRFIDDRDECEEIVQDIVFKLWQQKELLGTIKSIRAYLYRSVHNRCLNYIKHELHKEKYIDKAWGELKKIELQNFEDVQNRELEEKLHGAINDLPDRCREVFMLSRFDGKKNKEISEQLGISIKAVEANITRALGAIREKLKSYLHIDLLVTITVLFFLNI